ncbi:hypothetical protein P175DRAFT_0445334 [Aspergillus ochraceoroseus IBT 24754]|uniref:Cellular morphogenesis protein n=2 Tax=Aspergillus ochraceoroseus TaxID=138278 RepID=A0A2T5LNG7_9EURO|nr:uncharacterized protein P175DRAFT_0445334 [Aspergillus ochraceoroseus IBT 24754]KKK20710.1 hypothetical protein AOCH_007026 [Aspergillus ochraceoroseus]PTU17824.1 hypothetical protein P175DRAFT_0445334 [Aspergillus ochraceoroseus IBT 24754]
MRPPSLFGPATAGFSTMARVWLLSSLSLVSSLSFHSVPQPKLDLSPLGQVALTGDFDAAAFYSYTEQFDTPSTDDNSQSIITALPNGILISLESTDADIRAMCAFTQKDGAYEGIFVGGNFTSLGGVKAQGVALYNPESNKVTALPGLTGSVSALLCDQETNSVYVGGAFKYGNTSNAVAWVSGEGWKSLSFGGFNGPVTSIVKDSDNHIVFGGSFDGIGNTTTSKKNVQTINLQNATVTSDALSSKSGFIDPRNVICQTSGADGEGKTWLLDDYSPGYWRADMGFTFQPSKLRLYNTHLEDRGAKSFFFRRLPDNGIMNMTYTDPDTGEETHCDLYCPLSNSTDEKYRDFTFVNYVGMSGFMLEIQDWYGSGAGLNGIELFTNDIYTYAVNAFNEPTCAGISHSSTATQTGSWTVTPSDQSPAEYLTADVTDSTATDTSVVFEPDIKQSGNYTILLYTPGCEQSSTCDSRGIVNVTATVKSSGASDPIETQIYQTNAYEKYDTIYSGPVDASGDSFRPRVTLTAISGQGDITVVASRVKFELLSASGGSSGELNGLYDYDPSSTRVSTNLLESYINRAGYNLHSGASVRSIATHGSAMYVAGNFSNSDIRNILLLEQDANVTEMSQGGLNAEVTTLSVLNTTLYVGGSFTGTSTGTNDNLKYVASYSTSSQSWSALGGGVNGPVKQIISLPLNVSSDLNETIVAVSGDFDELLSFGKYPAVDVSGFAVWVPSQNNWLQNLNVSQVDFVGQLSAYALANNTAILAGSLSSGGTAAGGAVAVLYEDGLSLDPLLKRSSGETYTGIYDISSDRNLTILGGHFTATASNGSAIENIVILDGSNGTISGIGAGVDSNSTFLTFAISDDVLYAGGMITGAVGNSGLNGLVLYDLENRTIAHNQPSKFNGGNVSVTAIAVRPDSTQIYFGGQFLTAGSLPCPGVCYYDTSAQQWNRPGVNLEGTVVALEWVSGNSLLAVGNLTVDGNQTVVAIYSPHKQSWEAFEGASTQTIPGTVIAFTPASVDASTFWLAGQSSNGSNYLMNYDGSSFQSTKNIFGDGTVIKGLEVLPLASDHEENKLLHNDQILLVTGYISVPNYGVASAALFNGTTLTPFVLSSTSDGKPGSMSQMFYQNSNPYTREKSHHSNGIVVLVAFCCALGCVFLIVIAGVIFNKIQRRRQGYMAAPQGVGTDRPSTMRRLPPEYLFNSLKQPNPGAPVI